MWNTAGNLKLSNAPEFSPPESGKTAVRIIIILTVRAEPQSTVGGTARTLSPAMYFYSRTSTCGTLGDVGHRRSHLLAVSLGLLVDSSCQEHTIDKYVETLYSKASVHGHCVLAPCCRQHPNGLRTALSLLAPLLY